MLKNSFKENASVKRSNQIGIYLNLLTKLSFTLNALSLPLYFLKPNNQCGS